MRHYSIKSGLLAFKSIRAGIFCLLTFFILAGVSSVRAQQYTKGVGIYPGNPNENFAPSFRIDASHYRNLALHRPVYQSSAYDYNLTAQLVTDGIVDTTMPGWIVVSTSKDGALPRDGREHILDRHPSSQQELKAPEGWMQVEMSGNYQIPSVDSFSISGNVTIDTLVPPKHWEINVAGSDDGENWETLRTVAGGSLPGEDAMINMATRYSIDLSKMPPQQLAFFRRFAPRNRRVLEYNLPISHAVHFKYYRLNLQSEMAENWSISDMTFYHNGKATPIGGPYHFSSAWKSAGNTNEWLYVDLGAICTFDQVKLDWIRRAGEGIIQVSDDAKSWKDAAPLKSSSGNLVTIRFLKKIKGRYVRLLMNKPINSADGYILSEMEVMGTGGPVPVAHATTKESKDGMLDLAGGRWKLQRASLVKGDGPEISKPGYQENQWMIATVPGTSLVSYLNDGALTDPNFGENQFLVSDSYFYDDFWYRDEFNMPTNYKRKNVFLNFDGINWKAEIFLNGNYLGKIDGAFIRGKFDVSGLLIPGGKNVLAVRIIKNETPGFPTEQNRNSTDANGGELGADNPTFHASIGWDWIPTIRGRNTGIWSNVYLSESGPVTIEDPLVSAKLPLPDTTSASVSFSASLRNHSEKVVAGKLVGKLGDISFELPVRLAPSEAKTVILDSSTNASLKITNPKLWWPNGYGNQNLYKVQLNFVTSEGILSDSKSFNTGIREMTYTEDGGALRIFVNGKRFVPFGGNWGFSEDMLRYRSREYEIAVRYHKEMNFTMIRNWVGQIGDEAFYDACDKYGIMVWQDFWLANPADGPDPNHPEMFIKNMDDFVKKIRNHPSLGIYVGRNEGNPPPLIQGAITKELPVLAPGIKYIPNSAFGTVSGGGPYGLMPLISYFENKRALTTLHSEMGMPDIVTFESLKQMMPQSDVWPQSSDWGLHDFTLQGAQHGEGFNKTIEDAFGKIDSLKQWLSLAHWLEYEGYRTMFEAEAKYRMGLLLWMSHAAWPSLTWQTYDYYFEPTAAYFASKIACEPLHIQWNPLSDSIEVVNYAIPDGSGLTASMQVINLDGTVLFKNQLQADCPEDSLVRLFPVLKPGGKDSIYFVKLELIRGRQIVSQNLYLRGSSEETTGGLGNLRAVLKLPKVKLFSTTKVAEKSGHWYLETVMKNETKIPAINIRLKVVGDKDRNRILPVIFNDNYVTLMPGEQRIITMEIDNADTRGEKPAVEMDGLNLK